MTVRQAIVAQLSSQALQAICRDLGVEADNVSRAALARRALQPNTISTANLLTYLDEAQLQGVCEACGVAATGLRATLTKRILKHAQGPSFVAIDFETADYSRDSACAVGLARVENHTIVQRAYHLIRPPRRKFVFTYLHGITWEDVAGQPSFGELWPTLAPMLDGVDFLAAHNAAFDRGVLHHCCAGAGLAPPQLPFRCTVDLARRTWNIYPTKLHHVFDHLGIALKHHFAASDAEACALIVIAAHRGAGAP